MPRRRRKAAPKPQPSFWTKRITNQWDWHWRSLAAVVYLLICIFDLVAMPLYREITYNKLTVTEMVKMAKTMDPEAQVETLKVLKEDRKWTPLTDDMFHLSFGAILGVAALPQNRRRRRRQDEYEYDGGYEEDDCPDEGYSDEPEYRYKPVMPSEDETFDDGDLPPPTGRLE